MATKWNKFKRKRREQAKRARGIVDKKLLNKQDIDLTEREREINELMVDGNIPTKRRKDGTILLREVTDEEGKKVADDSINQLIPVDIFSQNYDEIEVDKIIESNMEELLPDTLSTEQKVKQFFLDYENLKDIISGNEGDESHQHLIDTSVRYIPSPEEVIKLPDPENILENGTFEEGNLPAIVSKALNQEVIDDPTQIRPTAKILRFFGSKQGHIILHKKEGAKLKRGGLYECSYLIYISDDYDGSHGVEFSTWGNLDPDKTVMTPIGSLPYNRDRQIIKGRWVRRNFWVKLPHTGEPSDFNWKFGYPMGKRPVGVDPGEAIGSSIYRIKLKKNYEKPSKEDFLKHKRLGMLWRELSSGNVIVGAHGQPLATGATNGMFVGLTQFFDKLAEEINDRFYRAKLMGTEISGELKSFMRTEGKGKKKKEVQDWKFEHVPEGEQEVGKTVHPLSIHDKDKTFEIVFAIKDVSKKHHTAILQNIMERIGRLTWHPSEPTQDMFDEPKEIFDPSVKVGDMPQIQVVTTNPPPQNINIKQPEIGMKMDGISVKQDGSPVNVPVEMGSSTETSTDVAGAEMEGGLNEAQVRNVVTEEIGKASSALSGGGGGGSSTPAKKGGIDSYTFRKAGADIKDAATKGGALGKKILGAPGQLVGNIVGGSLGIVKSAGKAVAAGVVKAGKAVGKGLRKAGRFLRRAFSFRRRRRRRRRRWFSDIRLKQNIMLMGQSKSGLNVYEYNYLWSNKKYRGVMAQELLDTHPQAVSKLLGFYSVDYNKIDVDIERV